jgi:hypothetical protein
MNETCFAPPNHSGICEGKIPKDDKFIDGRSILKGILKEIGWTGLIWLGLDTNEEFL